MILALGLNACSPRRLMLNEFVHLVDNGAGAFEQDDDLDLLEQALPANIKLLETMLVNDPANRTLMVLLARLYGSYSFLFFEDRLERAMLDDPGRRSSEASEQASAAGALKAKADRYYLKGATYALRALEVRHPKAHERLRRVDSRSSFMALLDRRDVPALFWYGFNLGSYVNLNRDSVRALSRAALAEASMKRVAALDPAYHHGGCHLFLMIYYASRAPMMGGNLDAARTHYQQIRSIAGEAYRLADVYYARYYLRQIQDRIEFQRVLQKVAAADESPPRFRLYNKIAGDRARFYLSVTDRLFD